MLGDMRRETCHPSSITCHPASCILHPFGLTLVELLVAMAIMVTVSASAALIFRSITRAWQTGELRTERYQQARLLLDLFVREISSSVSNVRYPMIGTNVSEGDSIYAGSVYDELSFSGTLPGRTGIVERGYWVDGAGDFWCHDDEPADGDYTTGVSELCGHDVSQFTVSYFDGTEWVDRWTGETDGALPRAIHIVVTIGRQQPEKFDTIIYVPTS